jgi:predicted RNA binding protein YcfA (HicA-like mRNA interferase family)
MLGFKEFIEEGQKFNVAMSHRDVVKHITKRGWKLDRQSGSHDVYVHHQATHNLAVPRHKGDLAPGTVRQLVKAADVLDKKAAA